jgi:hypothetical protein
MDTDGWQAARLIPTSGISGTDEAERRATSALLAVMQAVREFRVAVLKPLGAPTGQLESFVEVPFKLGEDRTVIPDGLLSVTRGSTSWVALVEVKTGAAELQQEQVENYIDVARDLGFSTVLTISNQMAPAMGVHPVEVDKRKLKKVNLLHLSWSEILTHAVQIRVHHGVSDPDQAWILGELIRYLEHPKSGALDFSDMGAHWVAIRDSVAAGTLRASDKGVLEVASRWDQLLRFAALRLGRELGADVQVVVNRKEQADPASRLARYVAELVDNGALTGQIRIPDAVGVLDVIADLRASQATISVEVEAPKEGRLPTRVSWLVRQLKDAPSQLRIDGLLMNTKASTSELLSAVIADPAVLLDPQKRDFRAFRITATSPLGAKRGTGRGSFIDSVLAMTDGFYGDVVQQVRPWSAKAPQLPRSGKTAVEEAGINTTPPARDLEEEEGSTKAATDELSDRVVDAEQEREPKTWRNTDQDDWTPQQWDSWAERDFPTPTAAAVVPEPTEVDWKDTDSATWTSDQWNAHARAVDRGDPGL